MALSAKLSLTASTVSLVNLFLSGFLFKLTATVLYCTALHWRPVPATLLVRGGVAQW